MSRTPLTSNGRSKLLANTWIVPCLFLAIVGFSNKGFAQVASLGADIKQYAEMEKPGFNWQNAANDYRISNLEADLNKDNDTGQVDMNKAAKKAALKSTLIPGWGQITNDQVWKVPILYAGLGICAYAINFNHQNYKEFAKAYRLRTDGDTTTIDKYHPETGGAVIASDEVLRESREFYRRNRTLSYVATGLVYVANILDAYVFAHLKEFDVSDDLSMRVNPPNFANIANRNHITLGISLKLKP